MRPTFLLCIAVLCLMAGGATARTLSEAEERALDRVDAATLRLSARCSAAEGPAIIRAGTGFLVTAGGLVLTARHVVQALQAPGCEPAEATGRATGLAPVRWVLVTVSADAGVDAAVVRLTSGADYPFIPVGRSRLLRATMEARVHGYNLGQSEPSTHLGRLTADSSGVDANFTVGASGSALTLRYCAVAVGIATGALGLETGVAQQRYVPMDKVFPALDLGRLGLAQEDGPCEPWPRGAQPNGTYLVKRSEAQREIPYLRLPQGFRLHFSSEVKTVQLRAWLLEVGRNVIIDVSAQQDAPAAAAHGTDRPGQPSWGVVGAAGEKGSDGMSGTSGLDFTLRADLALAVGTVWVRTDGGPGGNGGVGGRGQTGGGSSCGTRLGEPRTDGGQGGEGGRGGHGGRGGDTANVLLTGVRSIGPVCPAGCGPSNSPLEDATPGFFVISGCPGCPGQPGTGGLGGDGGGKDRSCSIGPIKFPVHNGSSGNQGPRGQPGDIGDCVAD